MMTLMTVIGFFAAAVTSAAAPSTQPTVTSGWAGPEVSGIYYETAGQGPAIVLLHGGQMDRRMWDPQFPVLAEGRKLLRYDLRGYGKSPAPKAPYSDVEDLRAVMDAAGIPKAHLVGLSLGGRVSIDFAIAYPDRVESLTLSGSGLSGWEWSKPADEAALALRAAIQAKDSRRIVEAWLNHGYMKPAMEIPTLAPTLRRLVEENAPAWLIDDALNRDNALRAADRLREIRAPVLILIGDRDLADVRQIATVILSTARNGRRVLFRGAGHILNMEQPVEFNGALGQFLPTAAVVPPAGK